MSPLESKKNKQLLFLFVMVIGAAAYLLYDYIVQPSLEEIENTRQGMQEDEAELRTNSATHIRGQIEEEEEVLAIAEGEVEELEEELLAPPEVLRDVLSTITERAEFHGVQLTRFQEQGVLPNEFYRITPFEVVARGEYQDITLLLNDIYEAYGFVNIENMAFRPVEVYPESATGDPVPEEFRSQLELNDSFLTTITRDIPEELLDWDDLEEDEEIPHVRTLEASFELHMFSAY